MATSSAPAETEAAGVLTGAGTGARSVEVSGCGTADLSNAACFVSIAFILVWHLRSYVVPKGAAYPAGLEQLSYCFHGAIFFEIVKRMGDDFPIAKGRDAIQFFARRWAPMFVAYLAAVGSCWVIGLLSSEETVRAAPLTNGFTTQPLLSLWWTQMVLYFAALYPLSAMLRSDQVRTAFFAVLGMVLAAIKVRTGLIDIRLLWFLAIFIFAINSSAQTFVFRLAANPSESIAVFVLMAAMIAISAKWDESFPKRAAMTQCAAMLLAIILMRPLIARACLRRRLPAVVGAIGASAFSAFLVHRTCFGLGAKAMPGAAGPGLVAWMSLVVLPVTFGIGYLLQMVLRSAEQRKNVQRLAV